MWDRFEQLDELVVRDLPICICVVVYDRRLPVSILNFVAVSNIVRAGNIELSNQRVVLLLFLDEKMFGSISYGLEETK